MESTEPLQANEKASEPTKWRLTAALTVSRWRLTTFATLIIAVVMLCAGLALMALQHRLQTDNADEKLQKQSAELEEDFFKGALPRVLTLDGSDDAAQLVFDSTTVVASSANMSDQRALRAPAGDEQSQSTTLAFSDRKYRLLSRTVADKVVIHTATPIDYIEEADDALRTGLALVIPALTIVFGFLAWWLIGRRAETT